MKTLSGIILGSVMAFSVAACTSTPMNSDTSIGSSQAGTTATSSANSSRSATPINCTLNTPSDPSSPSSTPGTQCPNESK